MAGVTRGARGGKPASSRPAGKRPAAKRPAGRPSGKRPAPRRPAPRRPVVPTRLHPSARVALVAAGALLLPLAVGTWSVAAIRQQRDVPMPDDDASPTEVVSTFLDALDARDCATARRLLAGDNALDRTWCADVASLDVVTVGRAAPDPDGGVHVPVLVDLDWRWMRGDDSLLPGRVAWGYRLERYAEGYPWRLVDQGPA